MTYHDYRISLAIIEKNLHIFGYRFVFLDANHVISSLPSWYLVCDFSVKLYHPPSMSYASYLRHVILFFGCCILTFLGMVSIFGSSWRAAVGEGGLILKGSKEDPRLYPCVPPCHACPCPLICAHCPTSKIFVGLIGGAPNVSKSNWAHILHFFLC